MDELILCVAPVPGEMQPGEKMDTPGEVRRAGNEGASLVHLHVRDEEGTQTAEPAHFKKIVALIRSSCAVVIEGSTGGSPENTLAERCVSLGIPGIEMGSLNLGSVNMKGSVYRNPMSEIRFYAGEMKQKRIKPGMCIFDLSMLHNARLLEIEGFLTRPFVYNFIFDVPDALPFFPRYLDYFLEQLPEGAHWFLTRHGSRGWEDFRPALERGGHVRVGFEDSPFLSGGRRARSNAELVREVAQAAKTLGRRVVGPDEARKKLGLKN